MPTFRLPCPAFPARRLPAARLLTGLACLLFAACANRPAIPAPAVAATAPVARHASPDSPLILISIDGFRWDYLQTFAPPTLNRLAAAGVHARSLTPSFPSKTFPNHYTLVTGLRPEHHGIVNNSFRDPVLGRSFSMTRSADTNDAIWWGGEPIWVTAERQGVRSACFFWPGSEAPIGGIHPSLYQPFNSRLTSLERVDGLLAWLALPRDQRPAFATLYFEEVDHAGHRFGPDAPETAAAVASVDTALAHLQNGLRSLGLFASTSLVIVSDHGMTGIDPGRVIFLEDLVGDISSVEVEGLGVNGGLIPKTGTAEELVARIRATKPAHLRAFTRENVPEYLHFSHNVRIPPVVLIPDEGWNVERKAGWDTRKLRYSRGTHGYDPLSPDMGALFIASGPAFKSRVELDAVDNIHVYDLLCATLGLKPAPNDGDDRLAKAALP